MIEDASKMLKSMLATQASAPSQSSSTEVPTYESIQRQLDELKLRAMKVSGTPDTREELPGVLLDSGSTHVLRPARNDEERGMCKDVSVTLAGDEQRVLKQTPTGSIIVDPKMQDEAQTIVPFGKLIEILNCTVRWTRNGLYLHHPKLGRIRTRIKSGCPEMTDAGQAAAIIAELEMKKVEELRERTEGLRTQLHAVRMMEERNADWRISLARYAEEGKAVDGLQALYKSAIFDRLPDQVRMSLVPEMQTGGRHGWNYLKKLPMPRRMRKRLFKSDVWVVNMYGGKDKKRDPLQLLSGATSSQLLGEAVVINVDIGLDDEWNMKGDVYKALLWGAMVGKVKAIVGNPPCRTIAKLHPETKGGFTGYKYNKELELIAKQLFLHLVSYTAMEGLEPLFVFGAPSHYKGVWEHEMIKEFEAAVMSIGVGRVQLEQGELGHPLPAPTTVLQNIGLDYLDGMRDRRPELLREDGASAPREDRWTAGLRRAIVDGIRSKGLGDGKTKGDPEENPELRRLTKEQGWKLHIQRDHVPFRKDCEQCVMALGTGRPHRRTKQKSAYVLSVDIGGPMRVKSKDAHGSGYKFFLAAAYTKPRFADLDQEKEPEPEDMADATYDFADLELDPLPPQEQEGDHLSDYEPSLPGDVEEPLVKKVTGKESGAWLWDDDTDAEEQQKRDELEDESGEGNAGIPMDHLYFIKPLKGKSGKQVLQAIQEVILELRQENLPVVRIHSDRAHELRSPALREWTLNNGILLTRTEGQAPQSNGTAERAVRYLKGHARKLLRTSGLGTSHWAPAMITAAHHQREQRLRPETYQPPCPFGTRVAIKKKRYGQGGHYDLLSRWTRGVYLGPVWDVRHGSAVLEDDSGRITVTTHIRPHLKDTGSAADAPLLEVQPPTRRRLKGKTAVDDDGVALRAFSPGGVGRKIAGRRAPSGDKEWHRV